MLIKFIMSCFTSLVVIYLTTRSLHLLPTFIPYTPTSGNQKSNLFFCEFVCFWNIIDLQHYVSSCYTVEWSDISVHFKLITMISHYNLSPYKDTTVIDYIPHTGHFIPVTHLFCYWNFVPLTLPHFFFPPPTPSPLATTCLFSVSITLFIFCYVSSFVSFIPHVSKIIHYLSLSDLFHLV